MAKVNASGKVVSVVETEDGKVTVSVESRRVTDSGEPSFKLAYEFPAGSPAISAYPLDAVVEFAITTTPPAVDQITNSQSLTSSSAPTDDAPAPDGTIVPEAAPEVTPEAAETPVGAPVSEPVAEPVEAPAEAPVEAPAPVEADAAPLAPEAPPA